MAQATSWYFAYGSNMSRAAFASRVGQILEAHVARLVNYEMVFNKKVRGGTAAASVRPAAGKTVYGVLYKIPEASFRNLDRYEGVPMHYRRIQLTVNIGLGGSLNAEDGASPSSGPGRGVTAQVYIATKVEKGLRPAGHYLQSILDGAAENAFPADYIAQIKSAAGA